MKKATLWVFCLWVCAAGYAQTRPPWEPTAFGVLLLGHGGNAQWNQAVEDVRKNLSSKYPIEAAFGMADSIEIQRAINRLLEKRVKKIVAVPLFISSHSSVIEQTRYVLGIRKDPSYEFTHAAHAHMAHSTVKRTQFNVPMVMTPALDDHPIAARILLDRAKKMSREPAKEHVLLVGHGPVEEKDNELWLRDMNQLAQAVQTQGRFAGVQSATLRDDAPEKIRREADRKLQAMVRSLSEKGRVLIVPHLISRGGVERHIQKSLDGFFYAWTGETLLPDPRIVEWVDEVASKNSTRPDMRRFKDAASSITFPYHAPAASQKSMSREVHHAK